MARREAEVGAALDLALQPLAWPQGGEGHGRRLVLAGGHEGLAVDDGAAADGGCSLHQPRVHLGGFPLLRLGGEQRGRAGFSGSLAAADSRAQERLQGSVFFCSWGRRLLAPLVFHLHFLDLAVFSRRRRGWWRRRWGRIWWRRRRRRHFQRQGRLEDRDRGLKQSPKWSERHERRSRNLA